MTNRQTEGAKARGGKHGSATIRSEDLPLRLDLAGDEAAETVDSDTVLRLLAEELTVGRQRVETGRVRVRQTTREHVETVDEELERIEADVERVAIGIVVETRPGIRETDDEIIIPVVEEVIVVERKLILKEEIRIRKTRHLDHHREEVVLRAQEAEILRLPPRNASDVK